jgi:hypothetical protein
VTAIFANLRKLLATKVTMFAACDKLKAPIKPP